MIYIAKLKNNKEKNNKKYAIC